ncbi:MAG: hypothetical protein ACFFD4_06270 [Candidatus Odinarchaeota archaeon]
MKVGSSVVEKIRSKNNSYFRLKYKSGKTDYFIMMSVRDRIRAIEERSDQITTTNND